MTQAANEQAFDAVTFRPRAGVWTPTVDTGVTVLGQRLALPVITAIHQLSRDDLCTILTEPRHALTRQFQRFFAMDGVELVFTPDAMEACATEALHHRTGARGLRTVIEDTLLDVMYEIPSRTDVKKCVVNAETIERRQRPLLLTRAGQVIEPEPVTGRETA